MYCVEWQHPPFILHDVEWRRKGGKKRREEKEEGCFIFLDDLQFLAQYQGFTSEESVVLIIFSIFLTAHTGEEGKKKGEKKKKKGEKGVYFISKHLVVTSNNFSSDRVSDVNGCPTEMIICITPSNRSVRRIKGRKEKGNRSEMASRRTLTASKGMQIQKIRFTAFKYVDHFTIRREIRWREKRGGRGKEKRIFLNGKRVVHRRRCEPW